MNRRVVAPLCASLLALPLLLSTASAEAGDLKHKVGKIFEKLDTNDDGVLTKAESTDAWLAENFEKVDTDKNAQLSFDEVLTYKKAHKKKSGDDCKKPHKRA